MSSSFGSHLRLSLFGRSHGEAVGAVLEGLPAGFPVDMEVLSRFLARRAPGGSPLSSARKEPDTPRFLSGLTNGRTDGQVLTVRIANRNAHPEDYEALRDRPRPGHADYPARIKYGPDCDLSGGGQFSGRLTAPLCAAGGICLQLLHRGGIHISAEIASIGKSQKPEEFESIILNAREAGDSVGGVIECSITGLPVGVGEAFFGGLESRIAAIVFGIPAVKGVEFGDGFAASRLHGSENNDPYGLVNGKVRPLSNHAGGILGGLSTGAPLLFRAAFKPTPSISLPQKTVDLRTGEEVSIRVSGRHDPCIVPRALPVVEAAAAIAILDALLEGGFREVLTWN